MGSVERRAIEESLTGSEQDVIIVIRQIKDTEWHRLLIRRYAEQGVGTVIKQLKE